ncbi:glycosyl transferase family 28 [Aspergillus oryzae]|uniref:Glycosyl transferase family 28 n=1 Tax=Aspergillus oryzae TaxID=5062 RepID=A0A1S9DFH8_ASPOZ|nr:glycosyl transferase family 28 [Aspergillus oryzae]
MADEKDGQLHENDQVLDETSNPPPAYSPPACSIASSEASLWTVEPDFAPYFTNTSHQGSGCAAVGENQELSTNLRFGSRTSTFIQAFLRPNTQPRLVSVRSDSHALPEDRPSDRQMQSELRGVPLDIVIMVAGENIEPFVAVGKRLLGDSHRVRIAAHASCESIVKDQGLDFFVISHDVIHPMSNIGSREGTRGSNAMNEGIGRIKRSLYQSYHESWRACIASYKSESRPFLADAIIANPLAHAHIHCAERLSIPLHIMSAMIWSPTKEFPHPLAHIDGSEDMDQVMANVLSYALVEETIWKTIIEPINRYRQHVLGCQSISSATGGRLMIDNDIPHTYFCPEVLVSRPGDWDDMINTSGYVFAEEEAQYSPAKDLSSFIESGSPPIYFMLQENSMESPGMLARAIQDIVVKHGLRAILSQGCRDTCRILNDDNVFLVDSIPYAWLLPRVAVVVHSGSADQSALALQYGKPSVVIPHTAEQLSRGIKLSNIGAAAAPLMSNMLSPDALYQALEFCLRPDVQESTRAVQKQVHNESGLESAIKAFYRWLPPQVQKCDITNQNLAMYQIWNKPSMRISPEVAAVLLEEQLIKQTDIVLNTRQVYNIQCESSRPIEGIAWDHWKRVTIAAKSIVTASDLVSMLPGMQRKSDDSSVEKPKRKNLTKDVGIDAARFFWNIALLPFTSTALVINTVAYGVKGVRGSKTRDEESAATDIVASYDESELPQSDSPRINETRQRPSMMQDSGIIHRATGLRKQSNLNASDFSTEPNTENKRKELPSSVQTSRIQARDEEHAEAICRRHLDRGFRSPRLKCLDFRKLVIDKYQS